MNRYVLALDLGASSGRAMLAAYDGEKIRLREVHRFSNDPVAKDGRLYWNVPQLMREIEQGMQAAYEIAPYESIAIDTWGVDYGLLKADGTLLELPRHYRDSRTSGILKKAEESITAADLYARTGTQVMEINTLFQLICDQESGRLDEIWEQTRAMQTALEENPELFALMRHPKIVKEEKVKIIEDIFAEKISAEFVGLLRLIVEKGHFAKVDTVLDYFIDCVKEYKNIGTAYVTSAMELSEAQKEAVEKRLLETTKYVKFEMHYAVDSALIGGMVIRIGDRVVDSSVRTKLNDLTRELSKIQLKAGECAS